MQIKAVKRMSDESESWPIIIINNHKIGGKNTRNEILPARHNAGYYESKLIINLKMLINLITVFIFIALPVRHFVPFSPPFPGHSPAGSFVR